MNLLCICDDWEEGIKQIEAAQELSALHSVEYTGKPFVFCPWCGELLMVEESMRHKMARLGKSILAFRFAAVNILRAIERKNGK